MNKDLVSQINDTIDTKLELAAELTGLIMENLISIRSLTNEVSYLKFLKSQYLDEKENI